MKIKNKGYSTAPFGTVDEGQYIQFLEQGKALVDAENNTNWVSRALNEKGFPLAVAPMLAHLSNLAYQNELDQAQGLTHCEIALRDQFGAEYIQHFKNRNAEGFACVIDNLAYFIFCGTNDLSHDWVDNLLAVRKSQKFGGKTSNDVHMGFARHFELLRPSIEHWILTLPVKDVSYVCTGHSLGGTLAVLMAQLLGKVGKPVASVMTFGSPAVGGQKFSDEYLCSDRTWRVVDLGDPIPKSTPEYVGFRHVGQSVSSKTKFDIGKLSDSGKSAPQDISIFPEPGGVNAFGNKINQVPKNFVAKALDLYRSRPRHCKNVYRSSMQRMLEENLPQVANEVLRQHYDFCGMRDVNLYRETSGPEVD
ncbi:MAG: hypothetical protein ACI9FR_000513 [Cryomorphaceae bacterium]